MVQSLKKENLKINIYASSEELGQALAYKAGKKIKELLKI